MDLSLRAGQRCSGYAPFLWTSREHWSDFSLPTIIGFCNFISEVSSNTHPRISLKHNLQTSNRSHRVVQSNKLSFELKNVNAIVCFPISLLTGISPQTSQKPRASTNPLQKIEPSVLSPLGPAQWSAQVSSSGAQSVSTYLILRKGNWALNLARRIRRRCLNLQ